MARFALLACGATLVHSTIVTKIKLGQDIDYPPYAYIENGTLQGFGKDIADGMTALCADLEIEVVQTAWSDCWDGSGPKLGAKLENGTLDACTTYTHTKGIRNDFAEFSGGILDVNKAAGLLTMLVDGVPKINGLSDLNGVTVVDVAGWAPTADTIAFVENKCTGSMYSDNYTMKSAEGINGGLGPNDVAMKMLRDGDADCIFLYADQAKNYQCTNGGQATWNCTLWEGFGTDYAYVQTGQFGYVFNGTTLALAKKGSGVADLLNPCLSKFMQTKEYYDTCVKHDLVDSCYHNTYFPAQNETIHEYNKETDEHTGDCSNGYCACPSNITSTNSTTSTTSTTTADGGSINAAAGLTLSSFLALPVLHLLYLFITSLKMN